VPRPFCEHKGRTLPAAEGVPVNIVSKQLGHASSAVTARYIDHIAPPDVIAAMQARTWAEPGGPVTL
jgi:integrase